jgi:hypothetical protein
MANSPHLRSSKAAGPGISRIPRPLGQRRQMRNRNRRARNTRIGQHNTVRRGRSRELVHAKHQTLGSAGPEAAVGWDGGARRGARAGECGAIGEYDVGGVAAGAAVAGDGKVGEVGAGDCAGLDFDWGGGGGGEEGGEAEKGGGELHFG